MIALISQPELPHLRPWSALRLEIKLRLGNNVILAKVRDLLTPFSTTIVPLPSNVISSEFHSGPALPEAARGLVKEYNLPDAWSWSAGGEFPSGWLSISTSCP